MALRIEVLGPLRVVGEGQIEVSRSSHRRLLSILALDANRRVSTDTLIDRNWGGDAPATAKAALQTHVSTLRKLLPADMLVTEGYGYRLDLDGHELDAELFGAAVAEAHRASAERSWNAVLDATRDALAWWRGAPYEELVDDGFAHSEIARLQELRLELLELRAGALIACGREHEALPELERLVVEQPLRERPWEHLMTARYRMGRHADALAAYRDARDALDAIGLEPGDRLRRLQRRILLHDQALSRHARHNLPAALTTFTGREEELAEAATLLGANRLLTLVGVGGAGKTRLAIRIASDALDGFPDGTWLVELAALRDDAAVGVETARVLGLRPRADHATAVVAEALVRDTALLVLDNCEHLLDGAADLVRAVLEAAPGVHVIATSREPLRVPGEVVYDVPPLSYPRDASEDAAAAAFDAVQLFVDRAALARPGFALSDDTTPAVAIICRRLDGIPLAIELAAGRVGSLGPGTIAANLDDRFRILTGGPRAGPERHRTLEAALDWSFDLLDERERLLLARLAVFHDGFTLEAAGAVCGGDGIEETEVLLLVAGLVDKSLVARHSARDDRYRLLETVRDYATLRLAEIGDPAATRRRHLDWCAALAIDFVERVHGPGRWELLERVGIEADNLEAAGDHAIELGDDDGAAVIAHALAWREYDAGSHDRAAARLHRALAHTADPDAVASCTSLLGTVLFLGGDPDSAFEASRRAVALAAELEPSPATVWVLTALARLHLLHIDRDPQAAIPLCRDAVAVAERSGEPFALVYAHRGLARALTWNGEPDDGLEHIEAALAIARDVEDDALLFETLQTALTLGNLHPVARRAWPPAIAREMLSRFAREERLYLDDGLPYALCQDGNWDEARMVTERLARRHLEGWDLTCHLVTRATVQWLHGRLGDARSALAELEPSGVHPRWLHDYYPLLAEIAAAEGRVEDARSAADAYLTLDVHPSEESKKLGVVSPLVRAELDVALGDPAARNEHVDRARQAVAASRALLERFPPPTAGSLQMETPTTYLALAEAELTRATGPKPDAWQDALERADHVYYRLYARFRLAEALLATGNEREGEEVLRRTNAESQALGAAGLCHETVDLAARVGVTLAPDEDPADELERRRLSRAARGRTRRSARG